MKSAIQLANSARFRNDRRDPRHGTLNGYANHGCRCVRCCAANTASHREWSHRVGYNVPWDQYVKSRNEHQQHGTPSRYNDGCRCEECRPVGVARQVSYRATGSTSGWRDYLKVPA